MKLNMNSLTELSVYINEFMQKVKEYNFTLIITVNDETFRKLDEDFFYRLKNETKDESLEFIPAENEFFVNFNRLQIIIKKES